MDNLLLTSNSALLIKKLRKRKIKANEQLFQKSYLDKSKFKNYNFDKSFNIRTDMTPKSMLPSLSSTKVKYLTKSNSRASSSKDESNNKDSVIKNKIYNKRKITLKLPEKLENIKKVRNHMIKRGNNYFKTENNQRIIFNNIGINYKMKNNKNNNLKRNFEKKEESATSTTKNIYRLDDKIKTLLIKNNKIQNEKNEKDDKIEQLEQKIDKLINFINNNEMVNLKNKINSLENDIEILKKENHNLKNELQEKNEVISSLTKKNNHILNKKDIINENIHINTNKNQKTRNVNNEIDIQKLKLISIDPDDI